MCLRQSQRSLRAQNLTPASTTHALSQETKIHTLYLFRLEDSYSNRQTLNLVCIRRHLV